MSNGLLLWADDEMELLKAHLMFLEKKGYEVITVTNGTDAIDQIQSHSFDLVLLDENMPGLSGLETLQKIKEISPATPVVMVTKSEEENIMDQAIGSKIADYLIKPVNPNQILLTLKKNIHSKEIVTEVTQSGYQQNFQQIAMQISDCNTHRDWIDLYRKLVHWELELSETDSSMTEMLEMQKEEANNAFAKFIKKNYLNWIDELQPTSPANNHPLMSPEIFKKKIFPLISEGNKVFMIVIDNFRYDQWRMLAPELNDLFDIDEDLYYSILPTATQYARNAIFSGLMPNKIAQMFPELWVDEDEEEGKNLNEEPLIRTQLERYRRKDTFSYHKINDSASAEKLIQQFKNLNKNDLNVVVFNFIDMLSHARTESKMVRELANNESVIDPVIECYDKKGVKYLLSLRKRNKLVKDSIDISKPMILHLMVDDQEIPLKFYMFVSFLWNHDHLYESNRQEMSVKGKRFLKKVYEYQRRTETGMPVSNSFWGLYPDDNLKYLYPIGPFAK